MKKTSTTPEVNAAETGSTIARSGALGDTVTQNNSGVNGRKPEIALCGQKMGQHPAVRDTQTKGVSSGEGLTSAYNTIVREKDPTVKPSGTCGTAR